jgi:hypothetical protein
MGLGRLMLRLTLGAIFIEHGTQKLFGWFGGHGLDGTGGMFESIGLRPGRQHAMLAGVTEVSGGSLIAMGLATPAGAAAMAGMMISALKTARCRVRSAAQRARLGRGGPGHRGDRVRADHKLRAASARPVRAGAANRPRGGATSDRRAHVAS